MPRSTYRIRQWSWLLLLFGWSSFFVSYGAVVREDTSDSRPAVSTMFEQLWESIQQHVHSSSSSSFSFSYNEKETATEAASEQHRSNTLSAPHVSTRGGPSVSSRRRSLYEHALFHHYSERLHELSGDNSTFYDNIRAVLQTVFERYTYEPKGLREAKAHRADRSSSLHAALPPLPSSRRDANRKLIREMFTHAYDSYMRYGWPEAEVRPLSCQPGTFDLIKLRGLTLIDALDTLVIMGNYTEFARAVERLRQQHAVEHLFRVDQNVSLFETTIRVLGGLLSAHQMALAYMTPGSNNSFSVYVSESDVFTASGKVRWGYDTESQKLMEEATCRAFSEDVGLKTVMTDVCQDVSDDYILGEYDCLATHRNIMNKTNSKSHRYWVYNGFLLELAHDLGKRLLPAFENTRTGIPYGTVNLLYGVPPGETTVASLAGGGTLTLEFELLSRLTGDDRFGKAAKLASRALWLRRSTTRDLNLFGKHIDIQKGHWTETLSGIGSNSDSFLEYLVKHYLLFPEDEDFWIMLTTAYAGVHEHSRLGEWYVDTDMSAGVRSGRSRHVLESLMAFYPGMQVLLGEITPAARTLNSFFIVRELLGFLPERFNFGVWHVDAGRGHASLHPLRPELLESCYFLHRATRGMFSRRNDTSTDGTSGWLWAADFAVRKLESVTRTKCGYAAVRDVKPQTTGKVDGSVKHEDIHLVDEMPSFFLSETLKYLYLTFDEDNIIHRDESRQWIFTTEAHPIHHVPMADDRAPAKTAHEKELTYLKTMIRDRLEKKVPPTHFVSLDRLRHEKWSDQTGYNAYRKGLAYCRANTVRRPTETSDRRFFRERQVIDVYVAQAVDSFNDTIPERNLALCAFKNTGIGSGMRKSCPNIYSSDLIWMHALNGGATDYADVYVSVTSDNIAQHPNAFIALGAADALGIHGSGIHPEDSDKDETCPIFEPSDAESTAKEEEVLREDTSEGTPSGTDEDVGEQVPIDVSEFQVATFSDGGGFVVEHVKSGDKVIATFVNDENEPENLYVLVYAGYSLDEKHGDTTSRIHTPSSLWRMAPRHKSAHTTEGTASFHRNVVMADFEGNSFTCEIELLRRERGENGEEREHVLAKLPCAPGLFGKTHLVNARESFSAQAVVLPPPEGDETGCIDETGRSSAKTALNETVDVDHVGSFVLEANDSDELVRPASVISDSIQVVLRGECTFYAKAANMKKRWGAKAVIVVNTEDDELFVMSHGEPQEESASLDPDDVPLTVLVTGLDGEDLLSIVNSEEANDEHVSARVSMRRQSSSLDPAKKGDYGWPGVIGSENSLQIFAKGGWGIQANLRDNEQQQKDWNLQLLHYKNTG